MDMLTFLKRRFSSGDLQGELADKREQEGLPSFLRFSGTTSAAGASGQHQAYTGSTSTSRQVPYSDTHGQQDQQATVKPSISNQTGTVSGSRGNVQQSRGPFPSAPTSPTRGSGSFMGPMGSLTGQISSTIMRGFSTAASTAQSMTSAKSASNKERQKILLIIDDSQIDWSRYFRGKKIFGDWDVRVEQAQYNEISMTAYSDQGCVINIYNGLNQLKPTKSFKPDFVLLRQHACEANEDWQPVIFGLMYGGTPCMNTIHAVYHMKNRPWLFAHLLLLRNRLSKEVFPLISQTYHTSHKEMIVAPAFPTIVKVGGGHGGIGKIKADTYATYQDISSLLVSGNTYVTTEPFVDAKCDIHIQKIGSGFKVFARKSISGNWKSNSGSAILEKVPMNERFKLWIDEVARMFGGLDICSIEVLQSKSGEYFIYEVNGSDMTLFGESQEDDRREIAELVLQRMQTACQKESITKTGSLQSIVRSAEIERPTVPQPSMQSTVGNSFTPSLLMSSQIPRQPQQSPTYTQQAQPHQSSQALQQQQAPLTQNLPVLQPTKTGSMNVFTGGYTAPQNVQPPSSSGITYGDRTDSYSSSPASVFSDTGSKKEPMTSGTSRSPVNYAGDYSTQENVLTSSKVNFSSNLGYTTGNYDAGAKPAVNRDRPSHVSNTGGGEPQFTDNRATFSTFSSTGQSTDNKPNIFDPRSIQPKSTGQNSTLLNDFTEGMGHISNAQTTNVPSPSRPYVPPRQTSLKTNSGLEDTDDTMKNLRKTFAGIFGDL